MFLTSSRRRVTLRFPGCKGSANHRPHLCSSSPASSLVVFVLVRASDVLKARALSARDHGLRLALDDPLASLRWAGDPTAGGVLAPAPHRDAAGFMDRL